MISSIDSKQLVNVAKRGTAQEFSQALSETGSSILANAVETFCKMDRETEQGQISVDQFKDLKGALISYISRHTDDVKANQTKGEQLKQTIADGNHPSHKLNPETTEELTNAKANRGGEYKHLKVIKKAETAEFHSPEVDSLSGLKKFLVDLTAVQGLYTAAVLTPGPLALSIKNFAREVGDSRLASSSSFSGSSVTQKLFSSSASEISGSSMTNGNSHFEKTTLDERVVPVLTELQDRLAQASVTPGTEAYVSADRHYEEYSGKTGWFSSTVKYDQRVGYSYYAQDRLQRKLESLEFEPQHVRLPETSISDFTKK